MAVLLLDLFFDTQNNILDDDFDDVLDDVVVLFNDICVGFVDDNSLIGVFDESSYYILIDGSHIDLLFDDDVSLILFLMSISFC